MAVIVDIAETVKDELNGGAFSQPFTSERQYQPVFELAEMSTLHVTVVPRGVTIHSVGRGLVRHDYQIDIAVQKKFAAGDTIELDPLMALVEEIGDFFHRRRLAGLPSAACVKIENAPVYATEHMEQLRQFTSVVTLTFRVLR